MLDYTWHVQSLSVILNRIRFCQFGLSITYKEANLVRAKRNQIFNIGIMFLLQEMYNNIVIYIVGHPPEESPSPNEMHIFQCVNVSAR